MFTLFIYALGFSVAPTFFASVDQTTWTWGLLVVVEVALILVVVFVATWLFKLDVGTASGLLAGAATEFGDGRARPARRSASLGSPPARCKAQQANVATAYALAYIFSLITIVLFASQVAPRLLGIDLRKEARETLAKLGGVRLESRRGSGACLPVARQPRVSRGRRGGQDVWPPSNWRSAATRRSRGSGGTAPT